MREKKRECVQDATENKANHPRRRPESVSGSKSITYPREYPAGVQAIAIGLSKARRAGVRLPPFAKTKASSAVRRQGKEKKGYHLA